MNSLKSITVFTICTLFMFSGSFFSAAQVTFTWNQDKDEVFKMAKEEDKFILLFVGRPTCPICQRTYGYFTDSEGPLMPVIDENFITWYSYRDDPKRQEEVQVYTAEILQEATLLPLLSIINPDVPGKNVVTQWGSRTVEVLQEFLTVDLLTGSKLTWYRDKDKVLELAGKENKSVLKIVGRGTSPNCQKVMQQLNEEPFKKMLEENFILWYSADIPEDYREKDGEEVTQTLPYISIIRPESPDNLLTELWGVQDDESLEEILKNYTVSNETVLSNNHKVSVYGNVLLISNQTDNEQILVFSLTGKRIASVYKNGFAVRIDTSNFPKGVLIVQSSTGWSTKVLIK